MNTLAEEIAALFSFISIILIIRLIGFIATIALITWIVKLVWKAGSRRDSRWEYKQQQKAYKQQQKLYKQRQKEWIKWQREQDRREAMTWNNNKSNRQSTEIYSPTGWKWNENTQKWDPPDYLK